MIWLCLARGPVLISTSPHIKSTIKVEKYGQYPGLVSRQTRVGFPSNPVLVHRSCDSLRADRSLIATEMGTVVSVSRGSGRPIWAKNFTDNHSRSNQGRECDLLAMPRAMTQLECYTIWSSSSGRVGTAWLQNGGKMAAPATGHCRHGRQILKTAWSMDRSHQLVSWCSTLSNAHMPTMAPVGGYFLGNLDEKLLPHAKPPRACAPPPPPPMHVLLQLIEKGLLQSCYQVIFWCWSISIQIVSFKFNTDMKLSPISCIDKYFAIYKTTFVGQS